MTLANKSTQAEQKNAAYTALRMYEHMQIIINHFNVIIKNKDIWKDMEKDKIKHMKAQEKLLGMK